MRSRAILAALLLASLLPPVAAAETRAALDVADPAKDLIVSPRTGSDFIGERDALDLLRVQQSVADGVGTLRLTFAAPPGEQGASMTLITQFGPQLSSGATFGFRFSAAGLLVDNRSDSGYVKGDELRYSNATLSVEGNVATIAIDGIPDVECFSLMTFSFQVRAPDGAEYTDWYYPPVDPCDENDRFDGAAGPCPASETPKAADVAAEHEDPAGDVREASLFTQERDLLDEPSLDIREVTSRRVGDRIEQSVTLEEGLNRSRELKLEVISRVAGGQDREGEPERAYVVRYWRFLNASQPDRIEGDIVTPDAGNDAVRFHVDLRVDGSTFTFSWCASVLPKSLPCFDVEAEARQTSMMGGAVDEASSTVSDCALAVDADGSSAGDGAEDALEHVAEDEMAEQEEEMGQNESPLGIAVVLAALVVAVVARRR